MSFFEKQYAAMENFLEGLQSAGSLHELPYAPKTEWPVGNRGNLVLSHDTGVELGNPRDASASFFLWRNTTTDTPVHRIMLAGPDLPDCSGGRLPFGKVVLLEGNGFDADTAYARYRALDGVRYSVDLNGYMMRAVSQYQREWSRVSRTALEKGFSFKVLGSALINAYCEFSYIDSVTVLFVTLSTETVAALTAIGDQAGRVISAMHKITEDISFDCDSCAYADVCSEVSALRAMHRNLKKGASGNDAA